MNKKEKTKKQDIEDIINKLNGKQFKPDQKFPYLVIGENKKALYVKNYFIDESDGKKYYDIDLIEFPRKALEQVVENALSTEFVTAVIHTKGKGYVHKEEYCPAISHYSGEPEKRYDMDVELSLRVVKGKPELRVDFAKPI